MRRLNLPIKTELPDTATEQKLTPEQIEFTKLLGALFAERWSYIQGNNQTHDGAPDSVFPPPTRATSSSSER